MNRKPNRHILGALTLAVLLGTPLAFSQTSSGAQDKPMQHGMMHGQQTEAKGMQGDMPAKCKAMMEKKQQMMQKCKAMDAKLDQLTAAMNTATGQQKIDAMAALLNELVQQRKSMHKMMMNMQGGMMSGMMGEGMSMESKKKCKMMMKKEMMEHKSDAAPAAGAGEAGK